MTPLSSSPGTSRQRFRLPVGSAVAIVGLFVLGLTVAQAQQAARSGEELYIDRLGCWNCHGQTGAGGAGPSILKSRLPLRSFVKSVRLPGQTMPRFSPGLASDTDLAIVYRWLDGAEAVAAPPPITLSLSASSEARPAGPTADREVQVTVRTAQASPGSDVRVPDSLRHRVTLSQANAPVANRTISYQLAARDEWATFTTDEHGEAMLAPDPGFLRADAQEADAKTGTARLRMALAPGRYALVLEAIDDAAPTGSVVVGVGTTIFNVE